MLLLLISLLSLPTLITPCLVITRLCNCPTIDFITQTQIKKYPLSAYLGNRNTYNPTWSIEEGCKITVDCSKSPSNNFYFMIFRSDNPPIFNRRFLPTTNKNTTFSPTGITCAKVENEWQWQFYGGKVTDMAFAIQPEECGCTDVTFYQGTSNYGKITGNKLFNSCNIYQSTCLTQTPYAQWPLLAEGLVRNNRSTFEFPWRSRAPTGVINDLTCVSKQWYFNSKLIRRPLLQCYEPSSTSLNGDAPTFTCNCRSFESVLIQYPMFVSIYEPTGVFETYTYRAGTISYSTTTCTATPKCTGTDTLVLFSQTDTPILYPYGSSPPFITCKPTPLATGGTSQYYWISDGNMLAEPVYGCIVGCVCTYIKMTPLTVKRLVGTYSFYNFMSSYPLSTPTDNWKVNACLTTVTCTSGYTLVVFDGQTVSTYSTGSLSAVCTVSTKKWTVNKATDVPVMNQIYAICVDFRVSE